LGLSKRLLQNKWRLLLILFLFVYAIFLLLNLDYSTMRWDEVVHYYGGLQLVRGNFLEYFASNTFYPPMFDLWVSAFFDLFGTSLFAGRLVSIAFSLLTVWVLFEMTNRLYGAKVALLSAFFFGIMPGVFWISRTAYVEVMLEFFFVVSLLFFFSWLRTNCERDLAVSTLALCLGFLTKYQAIVAAGVMLFTLPALGWSFLRSRISRYSTVILALVAVATTWFVVVYVFLAPGMFSRWMYAFQTGDQARSVYSVRFPTPVFYLIEMTWPYVNLHPISVFMYSLGLVGLGFFAWRRKVEDKLLLVWFFVVYCVFTFVGNRQWRYVMPLFPVLAISASCLVFSVFDRLRGIWRGQTGKRVVTNAAKLAAGLLIVFTAVSVVVSCVDAGHWVLVYQARVPVEEAAGFVAGKLGGNESVLVVCGYELFNNNVVGFYLQVAGKSNGVWQYPELPVDTFAPEFSVEQLVLVCNELSVKYVMFYEFGSWSHFFNTTLAMNSVSAQIYGSGRFRFEAEFGESPDRIFVMRFE
jgi:4-amino-4-deoxy-L-arabinose transferase-like glycosyltransferase